MDWLLLYWLTACPFFVLAFQCTCILILLRTSSHKVLVVQRFLYGKLPCSSETLSSCGKGTRRIRQLVGRCGDVSFLHVFVASGFGIRRALECFVRRFVNSECIHMYIYMFTCMLNTRRGHTSVRSPVHLTAQVSEPVQVKIECSWAPYSGTEASCNVDIHLVCNEAGIVVFVRRGCMRCLCSCCSSALEQDEVSDCTAAGWRLRQASGRHSGEANRQRMPRWCAQTVCARLVQSLWHGSPHSEIRSDENSFVALQACVALQYRRLVGCTICCAPGDLPGHQQPQHRPLVFDVNVYEWFTPTCYLS